MGKTKKELIELINKIDDEKFINNMKYIIVGYLMNKKGREN